MALFLLISTSVLVALFIFTSQKAVVLRDIDRTDAKFDDDADNRPKEYVPKRVRKQVLRWVYTLVAVEICAMLVMIWIQWP